MTTVGGRRLFYRHSCEGRNRTSHATCNPSGDTHATTQRQFRERPPHPARIRLRQARRPLRAVRQPQPAPGWKNAPPVTRSFVLTCIDTDVPSRGDDVNQAGRTVPADLPRAEFVHWLMANIPAECGELAA